MDIEGIDVAVIYGTRGRQVLMHDDHDPKVAAALARAHNDWTRDFCAYKPERLKFAAQLAFHDIGECVKEARRAVRELGAVAVIGNPNPINGRHIHDPSSTACGTPSRSSACRSAFHPTGQSSLRDDIARRYLDHPNGRVIGVAGRNPMELMMAFGSMAAGGVLERHPRLRCAFPGRHLRLAAVVALGAWTRRGRVRAGLRGADLAAPEPVLLPPVLRGDGRRREGAQAGGGGGRRRQHRRVHRLPRTSDGLFPHAIEEFVAWKVSARRRRQDPLGQLRAAVQPAGVRLS